MVDARDCLAVKFSNPQASGARNKSQVASSIASIDDQTRHIRREVL